MDFAVARRNMVEGQLRPNRVTGPALLEAMGRLPREAFVPKSRQAFAYIDEDVALGSSRYLMEPAVLGRLLEFAAIQDDELVLSVGCATGYSVAVLAAMASTVFGLEGDHRFAERAAALMSGLGIDNGIMVEGPPAQGWAKEAPYDVILIDGAVAAIPSAMLDQLAEGGRLVTVLRDRPGMGRAMLAVKRNGIVSQRVLFDAGIPILPGFEPVEGFVF